MSRKPRFSANDLLQNRFQTVLKTSSKTVCASEQRGIDGGKKIKGRKRHIVVDVLSNVLAIVVHAANIHDTVSGIIAARKAVLAYPQALVDSAQS